MRLPNPSKYPKYIYFSNERYRVVFCKMNPGLFGETDAGKKTIRIKKGMSPRETLKTFIHELLHVIEFEGPVKIKHKTIYQLENFIYEMLLDNFI